jgi:hypothetical protein
MICRLGRNRCRYELGARERMVTKGDTGLRSDEAMLRGGAC